MSWFDLNILKSQYFWLEVIYNNKLVEHYLKFTRIKLIYVLKSLWSSSWTELELQNDRWSSSNQMKIYSISILSRLNQIRYVQTPIRSASPLVVQNSFIHINYAIELAMSLQCS